MRLSNMFLFSFYSSSSFLISCIMRISSADTPWSFWSYKNKLIFFWAYVASYFFLNAAYSLNASYLKRGLTMKTKSRKLRKHIGSSKLPIWRNRPGFVNLSIRRRTWVTIISRSLTLMTTDSLALTVEECSRRITIWYLRSDDPPYSFQKIAIRICIHFNYILKTL